MREARSTFRNMAKPTKESFFERILRRSNKESSVEQAKNSLVHFERFCKKKYKKSSDKVIAELKISAKKDSDNVINFLDELMAYLTSIRKLNKKTQKREGDFITAVTAKSYFASIKKYLRHYRIQIDNEAVKQFVTFPRSLKEIDEEITLEDIQKIVSKADDVRKPFYLLLATSGIRLGEALQLKKSHFDLGKNPARIIIPSKIAKNGNARTTLTTREVAEKLRLLFFNLDDEDFVFTKSKSLSRAKLTEEMYFIRLLKKCGIAEKDPSGLKHRVRMHKFRKWFTTATTIAGMKSEIRQTLEGWKDFEGTYHNYSIQQLSDEYAKIENHLLITPEWRVKNEVKEKDKQLQKIKEYERSFVDLQSHVDNVEENLNKKVDELRINKVEKLFQKLELDVRKSYPRLANKIIGDDWESQVSNEKLKELFAIISILVEDDGGLEGALQGEDYEKFLKQIPKITKEVKS